MLDFGACIFPFARTAISVYFLNKVEGLDALTIQFSNSMSIIRELVHAANVLSIEIANVHLLSQSKNIYLLILQIFVFD